jgi:hypothetical protein
VYTDLSCTSSPRWPAEAKPNVSQLYLSRLSLAKPAKLIFIKTPASDLSFEAEQSGMSLYCPYIHMYYAPLPDSPGPKTPFSFNW